MAGQAHTLDATAAAQAAALRSSLFAATTPLCREPAFAGAGRCLKRGLGSTPTGVSSLRVPAGALSHALPQRRHARCRERCRSTAAEQPQASLGTTQSLCARQWAGAAPRCRATAAARHAASGAQGSQGVCRNSHLAASGGRVDELLCHCGGTAAPLRRRCSPKCDPPAPPAAAFPLPSAGARHARPPLPSPGLRSSAPSQRGGRGPCAGQLYLPHKQSHTSAAEEHRRHPADRGRHFDADALLGSTPSTSAQAPRRGFSPLPPPLPPPLP